MKKISEKVTNFLVKYKFFIIPLVPLIFTIIVLTFVFYSPEIQQPRPQPNTTSPNVSIPISQPNSNEADTVVENIEEPLENRPGLQKTESLPDGTTKLFYLSSVIDRPHIIIAKGEETVTFHRSVTDPSFPVKISDYTGVYGPAKWIFKGSKFYGAQAQTHIYPDLGIAFVTNPETNEVFEQHVFTPVDIEQYLKNYGEDIPAQP